ATTTTAKPKPATTTTAKPKPTTTVAPTTTTTAPPNRQEGDASYFEAREPDTCAHRTITFGTVVKVTNLANGKSTTCRVNDRGPYIDGRIIDLSPHTFSHLAPLEEGVIRVVIQW
ncbi:MAG: septal ring lytic transglycosylase RlpA family protein, partial [Actinobacteria bacterium]|nr:septal ring lytic transglycosylase RlpA family protein [Actinomycetota bacterium]